MDTDRNGLEVLGRDECLRLLRDSRVGRIGLSSAALPIVLPVNYPSSGDRIVLRTASGSRLAAATTNAVIAFEVDDLDYRFVRISTDIVSGRRTSTAYRAATA